LDLNTITAIATPRQLRELPAWREGDSWLGGGTWLFSVPQPHLRRLIDLTTLGWPALRISETGLEIAATCTLAELYEAELPADWIAAPLLKQCCRSLLASFKIWNMATVGGNICASLPAGSMTSLTSALDGVATLWSAEGGERRLPVLDLVTGPGTNALRQGELLRGISISAQTMMRRCAFRQVSLTRHGRSGALLIGTLASPDGDFKLTVSAATRRPVRLEFPALPQARELAGALERAIPFPVYYDDMHGKPDWRQHVTHLFAEEIRQELAGEAK
jgi:CO/xanthine dehydrogenase FAD-binding subunit